MKFKNIIDVNNVELENWSIGDAYSGKSTEIAQRFKSEKLGFHIEILSPKKFSCPYHYHELEEELFFIIEGSGTLRQNNEYQKVSAGDLIFFGLGENYSHQFYNHTAKDFKFIAISNRDNSDIAIYPDSQKINIRNTRKIFQMKNSVPYITDEENPSQYWVKSELKENTEK